MSNRLPTNLNESSMNDPAKSDDLSAEIAEVSYTIIQETSVCNRQTLLQSRLFLHSEEQYCVSTTWRCSVPNTIMQYPVTVRQFREFRLGLQKHLHPPQSGADTDAAVVSSAKYDAQKKKKKHF